MSSHRIGIVTFPGSNCEQDCHEAVAQYLQETAVSLWHQDTDLQGVDAIILPGGFSYGDYLRSGAIAQFSPIMRSIREFALQGRPVLGICNGFQMLTEAHLLPGALVRNKSLKFHCESVNLIVENNRTRFTGAYASKAVISIPVANADGSFYADTETVARLEGQGRVVFRYQDDFNGSVNRIAGICNEKGNVLGIMPHPERNLWKTEIWSGEGGLLFASLQATLAGNTPDSMIRALAS